MVHEYGVATATCWLGGHLLTDFLQVEISRHFLDHFPGYSFAVYDKSSNQSMLTQQINNSRYAAGKAVHRLDCVGTEDIFPRAAGNTETLPDIGLSLKQCERSRFRPKCDALAKLPKLWVVDLFFKLRLTGEDDLEELRSGGFQIGQKENLFGHFSR